MDTGDVDQPSVGLIRDASGEANHLRYPPATIAGNPVEGHLALPSSSSVVDGSDALDAWGEAQLSVALWVKADSDGHLFIKREACGQRWPLHLLLQGGLLHASVSGGSDPLATTTPIVDGAWHHIAYARGLFGEEATLYVDGEIEANRTVTTLGFSNSGRVTLGKDPGCGGAMPDASVDDVRLFARQLSSDEVRLLHVLGKPTHV